MLRRDQSASSLNNKQQPAVAVGGAVNAFLHSGCEYGAFCCCCCFGAFVFLSVFFFVFFFFPRARVSVKKRSSRKFRTNRFRTIRFDDDDDDDDGERKRRERERESLSRGGANLPSTLSSARMDVFFLGRERRKSAHKDGRERERKAKTTLGSLSLSLVFWVNRIRARIALVLTLEMLLSLCITYEGIFQEKSTKDEDTYCVFVDDAVPGRFADAVFCIFDGHAGKLSAQRCAEEFMQRICDGLPENEKLNASVNNNDNGNKESSNTRRKNTNQQKGNGEDNAQLGNHDILLDDRENAKQIWPKSLEQATRDAAAKINHDMRVHGRDGTTALIVMIKRDLHTNIVYVKTAWVGDTRAVIRYKNRTFNLSEDHTVMNLNERSRMGQYYRSRAKKSRVLQQKADELKSPLNRRKRNTSVEDFGTDSSNPSIEGGLAFKEWQEKLPGEGFPVSIAIGADPATVLATVTPVPDTLSEYAFAGLLRNSKTEVVKSLTNDLQVPANAEIVLEGVIEANEMADEGPYGDHTGYYNEVERFPVFTIKRITHREDPIYHSTYTGRPPDEPAMLGVALNEVFVPLLQKQFPEIVDFYLPPEGCSYRMAIVSMKKQYPGHAKRVMMGVWSFLRQFMYTKFVVVVDEDINIRRWEDVIWAITTRMDPMRDTVMIDNTPIDYLDFASPVAGLGSKMGLDATNKIAGETEREWGSTITMSDEVKARIDSLWQDLGIEP